MIQKALENLKIKSLNEMQEASLKASENNSDIILLSPTGSGKTLGFLLPILNWLDSKKAGVQALVIVPSRELALQIEQVFRLMGTGFKVNCCYGGHDTKVEKNNLGQAPAVLIGTPGRLAYHLRERNFETTNIHTLVLDEFDKALEFGFQNEMSLIINQIKNLKRKFLTSATAMSSIPEFAGITNPIEINFLTNEKVQGLKVKRVMSESKDDKLDVLFALICKVGHKPTLVFCNHREAVDRISELLYERGLIHDVFHGGLDQSERERTLIKFRNGTHRILITTDLAARGLDIPEIENVIHYQLPVNESSFVHRNGRTARMHSEGTSFLLLAKQETQPSFIKEDVEVETLPSKNSVLKNPEWSTLYIAAGKKDKISKMDIVGLLHQKGKLQKEELGLVEVLDFSSYAAVKRNKIQELIELLKGEKIKNKKVKIEEAR